MKLQRGTVVLLRFPFTHLEQSKVRPALVVSSDEFNRGDDVVLAAISSQKGLIRFSVSLAQSDLSQGVLHKKSFIKCRQLLTVEKHLIFKAVGSVSGEKLKDVRSVIERIL